MNRAILSQLRDLRPETFEEFVAALWELQGWETETTPQTSDRGTDVVARRSSPFSLEIHIQVKRHGENTKISSSDIRRIGGLANNRDVNVVGVVTTNALTVPAREEVRDHNEIKVVEKEALLELIDEVGATELVEELADGATWDDIDYRGYKSGADSGHLPAEFPRLSDPFEPDEVDTETEPSVKIAGAEELHYVGADTSEVSKLADAGIETLEGLADADPEELSQRTDLSQRDVTVWRNRAAAMKQGVETIPDVGTARAEMLEDIGVSTISELATTEPETIADRSELDEAVAEKLVQTARTWRGQAVDTIRQVGERRADRLTEAGVETVEVLAACDPEAVAEETGIAETQLRRWIAEAAYRTNNDTIVENMLGEELRAEDVETVDGVGPKRAAELAEAGVETLGDLAVADPETVAEQSSVSERQAAEFGRRARFQA